MSTETTSTAAVARSADDEPAPFDWTVVRDAVGHSLSRLTGPDRAAAGVVLVHLVPVAWLVVGGGLYLDDLRAQAYARGRSLWPFVVESNGTHLAPGARLLDWAQATWWPLQLWPAVLVTLVVHAALGVALWLLLRELVGPRPGAVVALALGLLSPALVPMTAWFRQVLTTGTVTVCGLLVVLAAVRYARRPGGRRLVLACAPVVGGLLFSERALAAVSAAVVVAVLLAAGPVGRRLAVAAPLAAALAVISGGYLALYARGSYDDGNTGGLTAGDAASFVWRTVVRDVVPSVLGGPVRWADNGAALSAVDPPTTVVAIAWLLVLLGCLLVVRRRGLVALLGTGLGAASYVLPVLAMVFVGRYAGFRSAIADDLRLYGDLAVAVLVAGTVAGLGTRRPVERQRTRRAVRDRRRARWAWPVGILVGLLVVGCSIPSWGRFADRWHRNPSTAWLSTLSADLDTQQRDVTARATVLDTPVPDGVMPSWLQDEITTSDLVLLTHPQQQMSVADGRVRLVGDDGQLVPAQLRPLGSSPAPASTDYCGTVVPAAPAAPTTVQLASSVPYYRGMLVRVQLLTVVATRLEVDVVDGRGVVTPAEQSDRATVDPGPHTVLLRVPFGTDVSAVRVHSTAEHLCVPRVSVVLPETAP